jgi:TolB-like protein
MDSSLPGNVVINGIEVDLEGNTLRQPNGAMALLRPQSFATLRYLIANANRLVSKAELHEAVWFGVAVTDDSLVQCVHEVRRALGDDRHAILQTVSRRGYRLVLPEDGRSADGASIAVLPFASFGGAGNERLADGLADDLITSLSKVPGLFVIARNSSFAYRGQATDVRTISAELGVRYLLDGSLSLADSRIRINAQLIEGASAGHVWAGRFDGAAEDVFELQDRLTERIVGVIEPSLRRAEIERARRKQPGSLDAYDLYLRALPHAFTNSVAETDEALRLLDRSLQLDPDYLAAHGCAAWCREQRYFRSGFDPADRGHAEVVLAVNADDPQAMSIGAFVRGILTRDYDAAVEVFDRTLALNPNSALAYGFSALVSAFSERDARAVEHARKALRLSPLDDPLNYHPYCALGITALFSGRHGEAVTYANLTIRANPAFSIPFVFLVVAHVKLGDLAAARTAARQLLDVAPGFTIGGFARMDQFRPPLMADLTRALLDAGVPEG